MKRKTGAPLAEQQLTTTPESGVAVGRLIPFPGASCLHCTPLRETGCNDLVAAMDSAHLRAPYAGFSHLPVALHRWRESRGLKISAAASGLGVAASTWGHWETGFRFPTGSVLVDLVKYTGLSLVELVCEHAQQCPLHQLSKRALDN